MNHIGWLCLLDDRFTLKFDPPFDVPLSTIKDKIDFILSEVYHENRSWHNWLPLEWRFRNSISINYINLSHNYRDLESFDKILMLVCDPEIAYRSYVKLNPYLNDRTKEQFYREVDDFIVAADLSKNRDHIKILSSSKLLHQVLDKTFYNELINWFGFDDNYSSSQMIHTAWYAAHKKAEIEIVHHLKELSVDKKVKKEVYEDIKELYKE